jgi:hypothetical protein
MLLVVLYGCENWYLVLREEHLLRVFTGVREKSLNPRERKEHEA